MADSDAKKIIEMEALEAREALLKSESYFDVDLPDYFDFEPMLKGLSEKIGGQPLSNFWNSKPGEQDGVNHIILHNKDGKFAWRPQELIHPVIYLCGKGGVQSALQKNHEPQMEGASFETIL